MLNTSYIYDRYLFWQFYSTCMLHRYMTCESILEEVIVIIVTYITCIRFNSSLYLIYYLKGKCRYCHHKFDMSRLFRTDGRLFYLSYFIFMMGLSILYLSHIALTFILFVKTYIFHEIPDIYLLY